MWVRGSGRGGGGGRCRCALVAPGNGAPVRQAEPLRAPGIATGKINHARWRVTDSRVRRAAGRVPGSRPKPPYTPPTRNSD